MPLDGSGDINSKAKEFHLKGPGGTFGINGRAERGLLQQGRGAPSEGQRGTVRKARGSKG